MHRLMKVVRKANNYRDSLDCTQKIIGVKHSR